MNDSESKTDGIAVIGMSCRFPMANNVEEFWNNLCKGKECISFFTDEEIIRENGEEYKGILSNPDYVNAGGVIDDIDLFDADFFGYSPNEAEIIDPQQRLFMTCSWEALEDAGYYKEYDYDRIGVFAGSSISTYFLNNLFSRDFHDTGKQMMLLQGNDKDHLVTRVSYKLNLTGPSINIQNACSTSLVAVHQAYQSILNGECDLALAGGVSVKVPQKAGYLYQNGSILSPDGHCRAFDARANGTVFGNGAGVVVLKSLEKTVEDRDNIYAVIKGTAVNNDGNYKVGYTAPSEQGQAAVIAEALAVSDVTPDTIDYIEAHGTGTSLGDSIELNALKKVFGSGSGNKNYCAVGSVKSNIGHLDRAAGIAGLIKVILALKNKKIPPSLHYEEPNPQSDISDSPFYINTELKEWTKDKGKRRAGVSSFGIGGTNVHAVLEEVPVYESLSSGEGWNLLTLSAKTKNSLDKYSIKLSDFLKENNDINISNVAYTLQVGRKPFAWRRILLCENIIDACNKLECVDGEKVSANINRARDRDIIFMFPGQGLQYINMAKNLYEKEPCFNKEINNCLEILKNYSNIDFKRVLYHYKYETDEIGNPIMFIIEYALAKMLMNFGVIPNALIGHGVGEYTAACISGVLSLKDAIYMVVKRVELMQNADSDDFKNIVGNIHIGEPKIPYISGITGKWISIEDVNSEEYWVKHLYLTVPFADMIKTLFTCNNPIFLEVSPGNALCTFVEQAKKENTEDKTIDIKVLPVLSDSGSKEGDIKYLLETLGKLWLFGIEINWDILHGMKDRRRISLPKYQWDFQSYWIESHHNIILNKLKEISKGKFHKRPDMLTSYKEPRNSIEKLVAETWQDIFKIKKIGIYDDFFELGGHSLMATQLVSRLNNIFGTDISLREIFEVTTIADISKIIEEKLMKTFDFKDNGMFFESIQTSSTDEE